jgi:hypothetical protein
LDERQGTIGMMDDRGGTRQMRQETREKARDMGGKTSDPARDKRQGKELKSS